MWQQFKNIYHLVWAIIALVMYGFPSKKLYTIGVTGTDGKTTTALLITKILTDAGKKTVSVTTLGATINGKKYETGLHVTTPSSVGIQKFLKLAVSEGCTHAVIESSSHALDQNRVFGINFDISVLTNISHEHLDYHKTIEKYTKAKLKLFRAAKIAVLNMDDSSYESIASRLPNKEILTYSLHVAETDFNPQKFPITTQLVGDYNLQNCLAAAAATDEAGLGKEQIQKSIAEFKNPKGRQDVVYKKEFQVIIDFAITPNAFEKLLSDIAHDKKGRIIHLFGSAGRRDSDKRPLMGKISSQYADIIILTADDPRDEGVENINKQIKAGIQDFTELNSSQYQFNTDAEHILFDIPDRKDAIELAVQLAKPNDIVLLTGKAHEQSLAYPGEERPWDEYATVREALEYKRD